MNTRSHGFTLLELLFSLALVALLMTGLVSLFDQALQAQRIGQQRNDLLNQARFAMQRMVSVTRSSTKLILPLVDNPATGWREDHRQQSVPSQPPEPGSTLATAVLAVSLPADIDDDGDGWADANNDRDYLDLNNNGFRGSGEPELIDEDPGADLGNDLAPGLVGIDDNGDGVVDDSLGFPASADDDEDGVIDEDGIGLGDEDADAGADEDPGADANNDSAAGVAGVDDDYDGNVDEGAAADDDEDGQSDEDGPDAVVFYLSGGQLIERRPSFVDENNDTLVDGRDFRESVIAEPVSWFSVQRLVVNGLQMPLVEIGLQLGDSEANAVRLTRRVAVGGLR